MPSWDVYMSGYWLWDRSFGQGWRDKRVFGSSAEQYASAADGDRIRMLVGGVV